MPNPEKIRAKRGAQKGGAREGRAKLTRSGGPKRWRAQRVGVQRGGGPNPEKMEGERVKGVGERKSAKAERPKISRAASPNCSTFVKKEKIAPACFVFRAENERSKTEK